MSKLVDKDKLAKLAQALDTRAKGAVAVEKTRAEAAEAAIDSKANKNTGDIAAINNTTTGILATAKGYTDTKVNEINGVNGELADRIGAVEAKNTDQDTKIGKNTSDLAAEVTRAKAAEAANAGAIAAEVTNRTEAVAGVTSDLTNEVTRAKAAEQANAGAITTETSRATAAEGTLNAAIVKLNGANTVDGSVAKTVKDAVEPVKTSVTALTGRVDANEAAISSNTAAIATGDANTLQAAKTYADTQIAGLVDGAPEALNTLKELSDAITEHNDVYESYVNTVSGELAKKVDKVAGSRLITEAEAAKFNAKAEAADVAKSLTDAKAYTDEKIGEVNGANAAITTRVGALEGKVGDASSGLVKDVADIKAKNTAQDTAITEAKGQADKGVADAAAAKIVADKGVTDAAAAKGVADSALTAANTAQADVNALELVVGTSTEGLVKKVNDNASAIATINNATTGILKQSKDYTNSEIAKVNTTVSGVSDRVDAVEGKNTSQDTAIGKNASDLAAEVTRAKAAEKVNADALIKLNGTGLGSVANSINEALAPYSNTAAVKAMVGNVVGSLALSIVDDKVSLKIGGVEGITLTETTLNLATDADIDEIIAGLDL